VSISSTSTKAGLPATRRALEGLQITPHHLLIDAKRLKEVAIPQQAIIKGNAKSASIAAASILAKVGRDALMRELDTRYPGYGFAAHKGYPVRAYLCRVFQTWCWRSPQTLVWSCA
jgi:ribonuclease HII